VPIKCRGGAAVRSSSGCGCTRWSRRCRRESRCRALPLNGTHARTTVSAASRDIGELDSTCVPPCGAGGCPVATAVTLAMPTLPTCPHASPFQDQGPGRHGWTASLDTGLVVGFCTDISRAAPRSSTQSRRQRPAKPPPNGTWPSRLATRGHGAPKPCGNAAPSAADEHSAPGARALCAN